VAVVVFITKPIQILVALVAVAQDQMLAMQVPALLGKEIMEV
jgi:hypothetical protein